MYLHQNKSQYTPLTVENQGVFENNLLNKFLTMNIPEKNKISVKTTEIFVYLIPVSSFSCFLLRVISAVTASRALTVPLITP